MHKDRAAELARIVDDLEVRIREIERSLYRVRCELEKATDATPRRLLGRLKEIVMYDEGFQAALQAYHNNGGSSASVAAAALKAIGEE